MAGGKGTNAPESPTPAKRPASCDGCVYFNHTPEHKPEAGNCLRTGPGVNDRPKGVILWPNVRRSSRCGRGVAVGDGTGPGVVRCYQCLFWWQPNGQPITPDDGRFGRSKDWWAASGLCIRSSPQPSIQPAKMTDWFVVHADEGCGDGEAVPPIELGA